jgi:Holliday junction resolvase RusA-like endonuclease
VTPSNREQALERQRINRQIFYSGGAITVQLPLPPYPLHPNGRAPWAAKARHVKNYRGDAGATAKAQVLERYGETFGLDRAVLLLRYLIETPARGGFKRHDPDNLIAWGKTAIDSLTDAGILTDDRDILYMPPEQGPTPRGDLSNLPRLEIEIRFWDPARCPVCGAGP